MRYYYNPTLGANLSRGFEDFIKHDDSQAEHLVSLLKTIKAHEEETGKKIDANIVTWRGMMTKASKHLSALTVIGTAADHRIIA